MSFGYYKNEVKDFLTGLVPIAGEYQAYQEYEKQGRVGNGELFFFVGSSVLRTGAGGIAAAGLASQSPEGALVALATFPAYFVPTLWSEKGIFYGP